MITDKQGREQRYKWIMLKTLLVSGIASIVSFLLINFVDIKFGTKSAVILGLGVIVMCLAFILGVSVWGN